MSHVAVSRIVKRFEGTLALNGVSVEARSGEFLSILGPSGCGKSTLLRIIAGLEEPSSGEVSIAGKDITALPVWKRQIGFVFQNFALWPHLTVFRNVSMGLELQKLGKREIEQRVGEALQLVQLGDLSQRYPGQLSGGQQQRVALARAIVLRPSVLLLDEPLSSLDKNLRQDMQVELKVLQQKLGLTTIFVTHDQEEALSLSDRVVVMNRGNVEQVDTPDAVYNQPASAFVARFVGETTFFEGDIESANGAAFLRTAGGLRVPLEDGGDAKSGKSVAFVRPEWIRLQPPGDGGETLPGKVERVMFLGSSRDYLVELDGGTQLRVKASTGKPFQAGDSVAAAMAARLLAPTAAP